MPVNRKFPLGEFDGGVRAYVQKTNRKMFFEYVMLEGVNDTPAGRAPTRRDDARQALSR